MKNTDWTVLDARARDVLKEHDGIAHVSSFDAAGISRRQVAALRGRGVLDRPRVGWYCDPGLPWQVKRAFRVGGVADCVTAAELWGLPVPPDSNRVVHVHVAEHEGRLRDSRDGRRVLVSTSHDDRSKVHRGARSERPVQGRSGLIDALLALTGCVSTEWFVAALDAALHEPRGGAALLDQEGFALLASLLPRRLRRALDLVDPLAGSCLETLVRLGMRRRGIEPVIAQAPLGSGHRVDFLVAGRLVVEADGAAFHDPEQDALRDAELRALGYVVLRFSYERIIGDLESVLDEIEAAVLALRVRGPFLFTDSGNRPADSPNP